MDANINLRLTILDRIAGRMQHLQHKRTTSARAGEQLVLDARIDELKWLFNELNYYNEKAEEK